MIRLLTQPSSYAGNPGGYAMNQAGHAALGAAWVPVLWPAIAGALDAILAAVGVSPVEWAWWWPLVSWCVGYLAWEAAQLRWWSASVSDCIEDACFALGGALAVAVAWPIALLLAGFLMVGIARRIEERR